MYHKIFPSLFQEYLVCDGSSASFRSEFTQVDYRDHSSDDARPSQIVPPADIQSQGQSTPSTYFVEPSAPKWWYVFPSCWFYRYSFTSKIFHPSYISFHGGQNLGRLKRYINAKLQPDVIFGGLGSYFLRCMWGGVMEIGFKIDLSVETYIFPRRLIYVVPIKIFC